MEKQKLLVFIHTFVFQLITEKWNIQNNTICYSLMLVKDKSIENAL